MDYLLVCLQYFLQIFGYSSGYLLVAFITFYILRIKDSKVKIFILLLGLIKPFFILVRLIDFNSDNIYNHYSYFYIINNQISRFMNYQNAQDINFSLINKLVFSFYAIAIIIITLFRFYQTYVHFHKLKNSGYAVESTDKEINNIVLYYSKLMGIKTPKIYFTSDIKNSFYTFGFIKKKIIVNKQMLYFLTKDEKETVLLHELSHVKRHDNILNAMLTYLTDVHFYNPFTYITYALIKNEQEKDCDKLVIQYSQKSGKEIAVNILNSILKIKRNLFNIKNYCPNLASPFSAGKSMEEKTMRKRIKALIDTDPLKISVNIFTKIALYGFFLGLLFF